jgi:hypothetical protein
MGNRATGSSASEEAFWRTLRPHDPVSLCRSTLAAFDRQKGVYTLRVVDLNYTIDPKTQSIVAAIATDLNPGTVSWDVRLLVLAYMTGAKEAPLVGKWVSPIGFSGGDLFFSSDAHNLSFAELMPALKSPEDFLRAGLKIGGKKDTIGDASFVLQTLPRIPILFIYWAGDEEIASKISVLVDESAVSQLAIDALWLAIKVAEKRLLVAVNSER